MQDPGRRINTVRRRTDAYRSAFTQMTPGFNDYKELIIRANGELAQLARISAQANCPQLRAALVPFRTLIARANQLHGKHGGNRVRVVSLVSSPIPEPVTAFMSQVNGGMGSVDAASAWLVDTPSSSRRSSTGAHIGVERAVDRVEARVDRYAAKRRAKLAKRKDPLSRLIVRIGDRLRARIERMKRRRATRRERLHRKWTGER